MTQKAENVMFYPLRDVFKRYPYRILKLYVIKILLPVLGIFKYNFPGIVLVLSDS
jgi:hypothetical protein